jgi:AsmA protein
MKKLLVILASIVGVLIVAAIVIPFFIPMEKYKAEISAQAEKATGRQLVISGPLSLSLFPSIAVNAEGVTFSNAPGAKYETMASLDRLHVSLKLLPLLTGSIKIDGFELDKPVIHLETDAQGKGNWDIAVAETAPAEPAAPSSGGGMGFLNDLTLDNVRLVDGTVTYDDAQTGQTQQIDAINASLSLPNYSGPVKFDGSLTWNAEKIDIEAGVSNLKSLLDGGTETVDAKVESSKVSTSFSGQTAISPAMAMDGKVDLDVPSVRELAAWLGSPLDMPGTGLGPLKIGGEIKVAGSTYAFENATLSLDDLTGAGRVAVDTGGERIKVTGNLDTAALDLNPYMPPEAPATERFEWSAEPMDMSGLKAADLDMSFRTESLKVRQITIGKSELTLKLDNGLLTANLAKMDLYQGSGNGSFQVDARNATPAIQAKFDLTGVQAEPLLKDAADVDRLTGTFKTNFAITASGASQKDMVSTLNGGGAVDFRDGTIRGVDLAAIAATIEKIAGGMKSSGAGMLDSLKSGNLLNSLKAVGSMFGGKGEVNQETKFTMLTASWTANQGKIHNGDFLLEGPKASERAVLKMTGAGDVNLPPQTIDYEAKIHTFAKDESGTGVGGTVRLSGDLQDPSPCVVVGSLCIGAHTKPGDLVKSKLENAISGSGASGGSEGSGVKGLLKGFKSKLKSE